MNFSLHNLKESIYIFQGFFGIVLLMLAYTTLRLASNASDGLFYVIPGIVLLGTGVVCLLFAVEPFLLRDDPDIWE
jgi:hypothetical protein